MSKAQAIKKHPDRFALHRGGEYDGSDGISRTVFGGQLMPDQAAQELFDAGLIADPTPDAMWEALAREQRTVDTMKDFLAKAKEEIREAKREAKREASEWLQTQGKEQEVNYNPKEEILASLRMLDAILLALPPEIRGKIGGYTQMARINTDEARLAFLKDRLKKADKELETFLRESFNREWIDLLRRAKPDKDNPGERPTGVIDADALDILRAAEAAMWMDFAQGETEADRLDALAEHEDTKPEAVEKLRATAQMVRLTANWSAADAARREQAVIEGTRIYFGGLSALRIKQSRRRERLETMRKSAKAGTGRLGTRMERRKKQFEQHGRSPAAAWARVKEMSFSFISFPQLVNVIFGEKSSVAKWMVGREMAAARAMEDGYMAKLSGLEEVFENLSRSKFDGVKLRHRMQTETTITATDALGVEHAFTEAEAISFLLTWRQEDGRRHMEGRFDDEGRLVSDWGWTEEAAAAVEAGLSREGNAVFAFLANSYGSEYARINEVFRRIWNVSMPRHKHYAPLTTKPTNENADSRLVDPSSGETVMAGMTPGSLKNRSQTAVTEIEFKDAFQVYLQHARQMEHFIAYGEYSRDALQIVGRRDLLNSVEAQGGEAAKRVLLNWLNFFAQGGVKSPTAPGWHDALKNMAGRLVTVGLVGRVSTLVMQSLQLGAALYRMPVGAYLAGNARFMTGKLDLSVAFENQFTQRRFEEMPPIVRDAVRGLRNASPTRLKYEMAKVGKLISGADAFFTIHTYALLHDYHKRNAPAGHPDPHAYAHEITEVVIDQIAMPTRSGGRSWLELSQQGNPVWRFVFNFATEVRQKMAILVYEMIRRDADVTSHTQSIAKMLAVTWLVQGGMQTVLRSIMRDMRDDDDDEIFDEKHWNPKTMALSTGLGPIGGVPVFGKEIESAVYALAGERKLDSGILDAGKRAAGTLPKVVKGESTDPLRDIETLLTGGAMVSGNSAAAASIMHVVRDAVNLYDNFKPDED